MYVNEIKLGPFYANENCCKKKKKKKKKSNSQRPALTATVHAVVRVERSLTPSLLLFYITELIFNDIKGENLK